MPIITPDMESHMAWNEVTQERCKRAMDRFDR